MSNAAQEPRRWTLVSSKASRGLEGRPRVIAGPDVDDGGRESPYYPSVEVCPVSELDALLAENARLVAGLESIAKDGTSETTDGTMLAPGAFQARIVLDGSTRPLERYTERIAALLAERDEWRRKAERQYTENVALIAGAGAMALERDVARAELAALREKSAKVHEALREHSCHTLYSSISGYASASRCRLCNSVSDYGRPESHAPDCPAHPDFLTTSATESREAKGGGE